ncbi:uncharacterized protein LOC129321986 [Prosopis cineraria]|uniref:uncharacterized protein LOC129321986 n=1 Tax=Prosopis cineraria TaxID=364024 RepID=UPI002410B580|nr:uncharacterized protein LOC129321986 [Prosopis cineraria]
MASTQNSLKARLQDGEVLYGIALLSYSPTMAEIAAFAGYDFVLIDMEHGFGGIADALPCIHAVAAANTPVIIRVPENTHVWVKKVLDLGPQGIVFPFINDADQAIKAVSYCRYPTKGVRGVATPIVRASKFGIDEHYAEHYEKDLLIMCQVETEESVNNVEKIAAVDGVDAVMVGPYDLSASVGCMSNPNAQKVQDLLRTMEKTVLSSKKKEEGGPFLAAFAIGADGSEDFRRRGYRCIRGACDVVSFKNACLADVRKFKKSLLNSTC